MNKRISYLFGAGAETDYGLPQGDAFARETLFDNNKNLYDALADFYNEIESCCTLDNWISKYRGDTAFSKEMGRQIIVKTISSLVRMNPRMIESYWESLRWAIDAFFSPGNLKDISDEPILDELEQKNWSPQLRKSNEERRELDDILNWIESPDLIPPNHEHSKFIRLIAKEMKSYGVLEKYFYTVINPKKYGPYKYWKLVNYYWQAYFSIAIPICEYLTKNGVRFFIDLGVYFDDQSKMCKIKKNYSIFLKHIESISKEIWSRDNLELYQSNIENHYYQHQMVRDAVGIISTNYTPVVCSIHPKKLAYINGSLNLFEYPFELAVYDFCRNSIHPAHNMFFPFIFGTSSVKPVVHSLQVQALKTLKEILDESDILVIIGYGLNEDDNHLNSFIREFLFDHPDRESHRVVYCHYSRVDTFNELQIKRHILSLLRIYNDVGQLEDDFDRLKILHNKGYAKDIFAKIKDYLED